MAKVEVTVDNTISDDVDHVSCSMYENATAQFTDRDRADPAFEGKRFAVSMIDDDTLSVAGTVSVDCQDADSHDTFAEADARIIAVPSPG